MNMVTDDICLDILGYKTAQGKEAVQKLLQEEATRSKATELVVDNIISHGNRGAANGIVKFADGGVASFCTMYTFDSNSKHAKLKLIQTYSINQK